MSEPELETFRQHKFPARFLAKRFAVKEAAAKALGTGIAAGVTLQDFTTSNEASGRPVLTMSGEAKALAERLGVTAVFLTIADEQQYAVATVILESA